MPAPLGNISTNIRIGSRPIGPGKPVFIIAEIGINHNGSFETALRLIDAAKDAQASAVKFQKRSISSIYAKQVLNRLESQDHAFQYIIPLLREFELSQESMARLKEYCDSIDMPFLCTPFDLDSANFLNTLDVPGFKVASADLTNVALLNELVRFRKPLLLSTGMSLDSEVDFTVQMLKQASAEFALLHCVSSYPVSPREAKLGRIRYLLDRYHCPVGYSGHDIGTALSVVAVSLGACIVEKHITLDQAMRGPDHKLSLLPKEFNRLVANIRDCELALSDVKDQLLQGEVMNKLVARKSLVASRSIHRGEVITHEMLAAKVPGTGLSPQRANELIGRVAPRDFIEDEVFTETSLRACEPSEERFGFGWGTWGFVVRYHDFEQVLDYEPNALEFHLTYHDTTLPLPIAALEKHKDRLSKMALRVHCCEYIGDKLFDLVSTYPDVLRDSKRMLQRVIDLTSKLAPFFSQEHQPLLIFNVGAMTLKHDVRIPEINRPRFFELIRSLDLKGVHLLAQNMAPDPWYFGGQWKSHYFVHQEELVEFARMTGQSVCLDISHAQMACTFFGTSLEDYIRDLQPYVKHIHLSDAHSLEGEGLQVGDGVINFERFFDLYSDFSGTWVPEIWLGHVNGMDGFKIGLRRLAELHQKSLGLSTYKPRIGASSLSPQVRLR